MSKKLIEADIVVGRGSAQFFVEEDIVFHPPGPPLFKVKEIKKEIEICEQKVINGKVIFNGWLWKDINYKTVKYVCDQGVVYGPVYHATAKFPISGFVPMIPTPGEEVREGDRSVLLEAIVEGENDEFGGKSEVLGQKVYTKVHEKIVYRLSFKVVRDEIIPVEIAPCKFGEADDSI